MKKLSLLWKKKLYNYYRRLETKDHELKYLFLEITRKCNLSCIHCGSDCSRDNSMKELTLDSWITIINYFHKLYNPVFVITGGEPLVRNDLNKVTAHLKNLNARWGMVTNGFSLTENVLKGLLYHGIESITLSLDGLENSHKYIRRHPNSWDKVIYALDLISNSDIKIKDVVTCVYPDNLNQLDDIGQLLLDKGINSWRLFRIFPKGAAKRNRNLLLNFEQSNYMIKWIEDNRSLYRKKGLDLNFSCEGYLPIEKDMKVRHEPFFCRAGISIASILADGTITGCNNNGPEYYQGNLNKDNFKEVWEDSFKEFRDREWLKTGKCAECNEWNYCKGSSIHLRDKSNKGPSFCYINKI